MIESNGVFNILMVDDTPETLQMLTAVLDQEDYRIHTN